MELKRCNYVLLFVFVTAIPTGGERGTWVQAKKDTSLEITSLVKVQLRVKSK